MMDKTDRDRQATRTSSDAESCLRDDAGEDLVGRLPEDRLDHLAASTGPHAAAPDPLPSRPAGARHAARPAASGPPIADVGMLARVRTALLQM